MNVNGPHPASSPTALKLWGWQHEQLWKIYSIRTTHLDKDDTIARRNLCSVGPRWSLSGDSSLSFPDIYKPTPRLAYWVFEWRKKYLKIEFTLKHEWSWCRISAFKKDSWVSPVLNPHENISKGRILVFVAPRYWKSILRSPERSNYCIYRVGLSDELPNTHSSVCAHIPTLKTHTHTHTHTYPHRKHQKSCVANTLIGTVRHPNRPRW